MKTKSTIRKQQRQLRAFLDDYYTYEEEELHGITIARAQAYAMECALTWVMNDCNWTPIGLCAETLKKK